MFALAIEYQEYQSLDPRKRDIERILLHLKNNLNKKIYFK